MRLRARAASAIQRSKNARSPVAERALDVAERVAVRGERVGDQVAVLDEDVGPDGGFAPATRVISRSDAPA